MNPTSDRAWAGKVVLVTGGAGGIGKACGAWFSDRGATVVLADLDPGCEEAASSVGAVAGIRLDVTDEGEAGQVMDWVRRRHGLIGVLVNAAGVVGSGSVAETSAQSWRHVLDVNLTGTFLVSRATLAHFRESGSGKIVNLSSVNARTGGNELSGAAYAASKAGIEALTRHLASALAPRVQVNAVAPGPVATPMLGRLSSAQLARVLDRIPSGRPARPEEIAATVGFLASSESDYITGVTVAQNGGQWMG